MENILNDLDGKGYRISLRNHVSDHINQRWSCEIEPKVKLGLYRSHYDKTRIKEFSSTPHGALISATQKLGLTYELG